VNEYRKTPAPAASGRSGVRRTRRTDSGTPETGTNIGFVAALPESVQGIGAIPADSAAAAAGRNRGKAGVSHKLVNL
jgi:hypothetical protein